MTKVVGFFTSSIRSRILASFAIVILLVVAMTVAGYYQLRQVRFSAQDMIPESLQMGLLQDFGLAVSSLDANLERYFVIGGAQFGEAIVQDLEEMAAALESFSELASEETAAGAGEFGALEELEQGMAALTPHVMALLETASSDVGSKEVNQRILSVYSEIDSLKQAHQSLTAVTLGELQDSALEQERIASGVIVQFMVLVVSVFLVAVLSSLFVTRSIATPLASLAETSSQIAAGDLGLAVEVGRRDEIGALAQAFNSMTAQLRGLIDSLEQQVAERTADLARRSRYLEATADVARDAASILEVEELLDGAAALVGERFGFYHAGIFLLDSGGEWAVLQAASSEGGQRMLARGHRLRSGEGIVGSVAREGVPRVALDVGRDAAFFDNPDLPETRSEMALPLRARDEVIGVLDVQSQEPEAFSDEDVAALQTLADQVAVAISNARLFRQAQESLEAERRAYGELSRRAWRELLQRRRDLGFLSDAQATIPAGDLWRPEMRVALQTGEKALGEGEAATVAIPIKVRGQVIGVVDGRKPDGSAWTPEEIDLLDQMTDQLEVALEGARLYEDVQRRAAEEQLTGQITARMRETLNVDTVLQTAIREMGAVLGIPKVEVRMGAAGPAVGPSGAARPENERGSGGNNGMGTHATEIAG